MAATLKALQAKEIAVTNAPAVIQLVAQGKTLASALASFNMLPQRFHEIISKERELAAAYARAQELRADLLADEVLEIADNANLDPQRARNMIDARRWRAKTLNPKTYGERIDLNVTQTIDVLGTLTQARSRLLRPVDDQQPDIIDVTPIESTACDVAPTDYESNGVPDIFK